MCPLCDRLLTHQCADLRQQLHIPRCTQGRGTRETSGRYTIEEASATDAVGTIGRAEGRDVEARDRFGVPEVAACRGEVSLGLVGDNSIAEGHLMAAPTTYPL